MDSFDPYHKWLGIPKKEQPANHYRLLGITVFEPDLDVIEAAADRQMAYVSQCATGEHLKVSQQILNELSAARVCLLVPAKRAVYDEQLRKKLGHSAEASAVPIREPEPDDEFDQTFETLRPVPRRKKSRSQKPEIPHWMLAGGGVAVVILAIGLWSMMGPSAKSRIRSDLESPPVAVVPVATSVEIRTPQNLTRESTERPVQKIPANVETGNVAANGGVQAMALEIVEARYGALDRWTDLTERARIASRSGVLGMVVDGGLVGGDPYPGVQKHLQLRYRVQGRDYEYVAPVFHSTFVIDTRPKPAVDPKGGLLIHEAWYSGNISSEPDRIDVADRLRTAIHDGRLQANTPQVVEGLPARRILFVPRHWRSPTWHRAGRRDPATSNR